MVAANTKEDIVSGTKELLNNMIESNEIEMGAVACAFFRKESLPEIMGTSTGTMSSEITLPCWLCIAGAGSIMGWKPTASSAAFFEFEV